MNAENYELCKALESKYESHAAKFQQFEEQWQRTTTQVNYIEEQASKLAGCINAKLAEQLGHQAEFQSEFSKLCDDHQSTIRKQIDDHKSSITADIVRMSQFTTKVLQQNARLENQRDQKSSSSSGCCMVLFALLQNHSSKSSSNGSGSKLFFWIPQQLQCCRHSCSLNSNSSLQILNVS